MPTPEDPTEGPLAGGDLDQQAHVAEELTPLSPEEIAALTDAGVLDISSDIARGNSTGVRVDATAVTDGTVVLISGWRDPDLEPVPAFGVPAFRGLTPRLAAVLVTRYSRPGQFVLDLSADLAVEGVATAGARRYASAQPMTAGVLVDARQRGHWPAADLLLIRWPPQPAPSLEPEPVLDDRLAGLLRSCRDLLAVGGHLIAVIHVGHAQPAPVAHRGVAAALAVISAAARARLRLAHQHIAVALSEADLRSVAAAAAAAAAGERPKSPLSLPPRHLHLLVFIHGDRDD
jgi:hypothetical protein